MNGILIMSTVMAYFGLLLLISKFTANKTDNDAFFRGNRESPWYLVAFGMIGASLSGVTFVSVPGMVQTVDMTYLQTCMGFFFGYLIVAYVLLPLYYRLNLTSIYSYLGPRFGKRSYQTGASFFILSKLSGAALRMFLVCAILQRFVFDDLQVPFVLTVSVVLALIWLYTRRSGIRTIVWTDSFQTFCLLATLTLIIIQLVTNLNISFAQAWQLIWQSPHSRVFEWHNWMDKQHFIKQFFSGIFIVIVMTGLDQDMMQKNLTCRNLKEAQKNMCVYGAGFLPVNFLFLALGILLLAFSSQQHINLPVQGDDILPFFCAHGYLGYAVLVFFTIGIIAAAFSSADSALTALTTTCCVDIAQNPHSVKLRKRVHLTLTILFAVLILLFRHFNNTNIIDAVYILASYTYGPLLGLFSFGIFTHRKPRDNYVPFVAIASPVICYSLESFSRRYWDYHFGYELLMINGLLTFMGLLFLSYKNKNSMSLL